MSTADDSHEGELYFSHDPPHIVGYLVVEGVHYEIVGVRKSAIRTEIRARRRGPKKKVILAKQIDLFEGSENENDTEAGCV
jgi:hypothetical protein